MGEIINFKKKQNPPALILFVKNPVKGQVKTRLAKTLGEDSALNIYKELIIHTRAVTSQIEAERYLYYSQTIQQNDEWSLKQFCKRVQVDGDLGDKMSSAFFDCLSYHRKVLIIGSDCASLTPEIINDALEKLDHDDLVMGPALDGGYYLLGLKKFDARLFEDIAWSTEIVAQQTLKIAKDIGFTTTLLPTLSDIDFEEDWFRFGWEIGAR